MPAGGSSAALVDGAAVDGAERRHGPGLGGAGLGGPGLGGAGPLLGVGTSRGIETSDGTATAQGADDDAVGSGSAVLDAAAVRRWARLLEAALTQSRTALDALNVFPIADRDTGTNVLVTVRAGATALATSTDDGAGELCIQFALGAVQGAHGNSGVILAAWLHGFASGCVGAAVGDGGAVDTALALGAKAAHAAVAVPLEGTVLTVARAAAAAAAAESRIGGTPGAVLDAAVRVADVALSETRQQLPVLREAGVVDAGAAALVVTVQMLRAAVAGADVDEALAGVAASASTWVGVPSSDSGKSSESSVSSASSRQSMGEAEPASDYAPDYEVQFLLDGSAAAAAALRAALGPLGNSVAVAGGRDGGWNVHVHTDDPAAVLAAGAAAGPIRRVRVSDLVAVAVPVPMAQSAAEARSAPTAKPVSVALTASAAQSAPTAQPGPVAQSVPSAQPVPAPAAQGAPASVALLAEAGSGAAADVLRAEGVRLVDTGQVEAWSEAVDAAAADAVILFASAGTAGTVAAQAAERVRAAGRRAAFIPVRSVVQTLAAVAVRDARRRFDDDVVAMAEAAAATRFGSVSVGPADGLVRGRIGPDIVATGADVAVVAHAVVDRLLGAGGELVTVVSGAGVPVETVLARLRRPGIEVVSHVGGQSDPLLLFGVE